MGEGSNPPPPKRKYPPLYERGIPIVLAILAVAIVVLLFIILAVFMGLSPFTQ